MTAKEGIFHVERGPALPRGASRYHEIGPFDSDAIPAGLFRLHRLRRGAWGIAKVHAGTIRFVWDDAEGGIRDIFTGDSILIPPEVPHHLQRTGSVELSISFWSDAG